MALAKRLIGGADMGSVSFGPLLFSTQQIAAIVSAAVFLTASWPLGVSVDSRFHRWSSTSVGLFVVVARVAYVLVHWSTFVDEPLRVLFVWQGGFSWYSGLSAVLIMSVVSFKNARLVVLSLVPISAAAIAAAAIYLLIPGTLEAPLPNIAFSTADGRTLSFEELRGRPLVINLWASWCPPCRRELPMMAAFAHKANTTTFVFANQGEGRGTISSFLAGQGLALDIVAMDQNGTLARYYQLRGLPTTLFIDSKGKVHSVSVGELSKEALTDAVDAVN